MGVLSFMGIVAGGTSNLTVFAHGLFKNLHERYNGNPVLLGVSAVGMTLETQFRQGSLKRSC